MADEWAPQPIVPAALVIERTQSRSFRARLLNAAVNRAARPLMRKMTGELTPELLAGMARFDELAAKVRPPRGTAVEPVQVGGLGAEWVRGSGVSRARDQAILYLHGGAWVFGGLNSHRALTSRISTACGMPALALDYRMVPKVSFDQEIEDCVDGYRWLLDRGIEPGHIVIMGDSAGGYLTLATVLRARAHGLPMPAAIVGLSGVYDMAFANKAAHANAKSDAAGSLAGLEWMITHVLGGLDPAHPEISPVRAELVGLPPALLTVSGSEVIYSDSEELAHLLARAGVRCTLQVWAGQPHVFQAFAPIIPEAGRSIAGIGRFVRAAMGGPSVRT